MNILILNWRDPEHPFAGGAEQSLFEHVKCWKKKGESIIWFSSSFPHAKPNIELEGITILRKGSQYTVFIWAFLYIIQNRKKCDVIIDCFHGIPFFTPLYVWNKKIIALIHEVAGNVWFKNLMFPLAIIGYLLEKASFFVYKNIPFITVSESTKKELVEHGVVSRNIYVIHNGVNSIEINKVKKKENVLVFLGRLSRDKGIDDVLKGFLELHANYSSLELWLIGKEEQKGYMNKILSSDRYKSVVANIRYYGYVDEEKKNRLLAEATIMIHPSIKEGWGINVIEAASHGTPTVGYNVPGLRDSIQDGKTGKLVEPGYYNLVTALNELLSNRKELDTMSKNAKEWSQRFSWEKSALESYKILKSIT